MDPQEVSQLSDKIYYSDTYEDAQANIYRHVILPAELSKHVPRDRLLEEHEWRALGIMQSSGWQHYMVFKPEPHILLFRKRKVCAGSDFELTTKSQ
ncbi:cyclin-dependent kinase regulatory subunit CKS1 [Nematocida homosporus]|uniref:cyclin-dependent kinase regulatory subunit CKS1 n=1 Tax=Nematocida homosporus TaxID=1912981 RepID=UPI00222117D5|nr:cyclin-dependent kinase regulatory subunit CKS1 [Nematocida homosporus]KAI5185480.1 cyclin-dependent kinase regulatory subunit CKS1 [Nematocida homosporus]